MLNINLVGKPSKTRSTLNRGFLMCRINSSKIVRPTVQKQCYKSNKVKYACLKTTFTSNKLIHTHMYIVHK